MAQKIFIKTFGCQMNEYDSNRIYDSVKKIGFQKTENYEDANCYLLNTCHIRDKAKEKVYHEIGRVKKIFRSKKKPIVIVAGCVAQAENQEMFKREPYIDLVIGPQAYHKINELTKSVVVSIPKVLALEPEDTSFLNNIVGHYKLKDSMDLNWPKVLKTIQITKEGNRLNLITENGDSELRFHKESTFLIDRALYVQFNKPKKGQLFVSGNMHGQRTYIKEE